MTSYSSIWIRCPNCWHSNLMSSEVTTDIDHLICICGKCGINITKVAKQIIKDYQRFIKILGEIRYSDKEKEKNLDELLDLYNKVVIA